MSIKRFYMAAVVLMLAACGSNGPAYNALPAQGDAAAGRVLYETGTKDAVACSACHTINDVAESGPSLKGIGGRASGRVAGQSADEYLFNAIVHPNDYLVAGYSAGIMPQNYGKALNLQQLRDVIAYLISLS